MNGLVLALRTVDLARIQFALTSIYHFLFVPLTLGLAPLVAIMHTRWHRTRDEHWLRLTRFFGTLMLINFAVGLVTGLVQEFEFGMNWSVYSRYVGDVFGAPLAMEGLAAFFLESVFLGLWIFGWGRLAPRVHLATIWLVAAGTWLSAYFILVANSWMQHPVGYTVSGAGGAAGTAAAGGMAGAGVAGVAGPGGAAGTATAGETAGRAELHDVGALLGNNFALRALVHTLLVGLTTGALLVLGVACWHLLHGRNIELFRRAAALALIVAVPVTFVNLIVGSEFGIVTETDQPMKIAAAEALWNTEQPAAFSLFQIGGFSAAHPDPSFQIAIPGLLSFLATNSFNAAVPGLNQLQAQEVARHGPGDYIPPVRTVYWSMRAMAYLGGLMFLLAALGAWLYRRGRLLTSRWYLRGAVAGIALPFLAATAGWVLTEVGRQPWIVQGLLKTAQASSPDVSSTMLAATIVGFVALYAALGVVDFVLMRRYARVDPPPAPERAGGEGEPAALILGY